jgi:hypothetical protein
MTWGVDKKNLVVVESELDGLLINQEAGDLAGVIALGSAQTRPDAETDKAIREADLILIALDSDQAGTKEAWQWWNYQYKNVKRWPCPIGKDPTEAKQSGLDLRAWVIAGLPIKLEIEETPTAPAQSACTANQEGPHATKTENRGKEIYRQDKSRNKCRQKKTLSLLTYYRKS